MAHNRAIGYKGKLPWHLPDEYAHFLSSIKGEVMVMGRKSWEVFGADARTKANIVLSRGEAVPGGTATVSDLEEALELAEGYGKNIFIAGGGSIYAQSIEGKLFDEIWLSTVNVDVKGDVFFPELNLDEVECISREEQKNYVLEKWVQK